jgi:hypothetical protein
MHTFTEWLKSTNLLEAFEKDLFDPHPEDSPPEGGSSHDVYRLKHREGGSDYWSKAAASNLQTVNEYLAWKLYRLFGVRVADRAYLVMDDYGTLRLVASQASGKQIPLGYGGPSPSQSLAGTDVHKGFFVDAFLGHWDVVGNEPRSNLFVDDEKRTTRIDLGGLDFRATGPRKSQTIPGSWGPQVGELQTMAGIGGSPMPGHSSAVFGGLKDNPQQLKEAAEVFKAVEWGEVEGALKEVGAEVYELAQEHDAPQLAEEVSQYLSEIGGVLKSRFVDLHKKLQGLGL